MRTYFKKRWRYWSKCVVAGFFLAAGVKLWFPEAAVWDIVAWRFILGWVFLWVGFATSCEVVVAASKD